ncbi:unnamed protein product [Staurois parvus]|uniref:Reverse transcriptase zinc-binding domain-containing protein n=1 Tax=Staurois parvus TaxID=386267 RepID=A0ABN9EVZ0_9NEOB|nr:unnamed protein product [Staurois parvus]
MTVLPKLLYLFATLPVPVPMSKLHSLQKSFLHFIWHKKRHRIARSVLLSPVLGGLGAPDIITYYYATHLRFLMSWSTHYPPNTWAEIESLQLSPAHPCSLLWSTSAVDVSSFRHLFLGPMHFSLTVWQKCTAKFTLVSDCSPLTNILYNPNLPDNMAMSRMSLWVVANLFQLRHLVHPVTRKLNSFPDLQKKALLPSQHLYIYLQICHFFSTLSPSLTLGKPTPFERLCMQGPHQRGIISNTYKLLLDAPSLSNDTHLYMCRWSQFVQCDIDLLTWKKIWENASRSSVCVVFKENIYKIMMLWYKTPEVLHAYNASPACWCCGGDLGSLYHIFWTCSSFLGRCSLPVTITNAYLSPT